MFRITKKGSKCQNFFFLVWLCRHIQQNVTKWMVSHAKGYAKGQFAFCLFNTYLYTVILALKKSGGKKILWNFMPVIYSGCEEEAWEATLQTSNFEDLLCTIILAELSRKRRVLAPKPTVHCKPHQNHKSWKIQPPLENALVQLIIIRRSNDDLKGILSCCCSYSNPQIGH